MAGTAQDSTERRNQRRGELITGVLAVAVGLVMIIWPDGGLRLILWIFAGGLVVAGVGMLVLARNQSRSRERPLLQVGGIGTLIAAPSVLVLANVAGFGVRVVIGGAALLLALIDLGRAFAAQQDGRRDLRLWVRGILLLVLGVVLLFFGGVSRQIINLLFGALLLFWGAGELLDAARGPASSRDTPGSSDVEAA